MAHDVPSSRAGRVVRRTVPPSTLYRRAPHLVCYWGDDGLVIDHYTRGKKIDAAPVVLDLLDALTEWRSKDAVKTRLPRIPSALIDDLIDALVRHGVIETQAPQNAASRSEAAPPVSVRRKTPTQAQQRVQALNAWAAWSPVASYFHLATKDVPFTPRLETIRTLRQRTVDDPPPPALKAIAGNVTIALPAPALTAKSTTALPDVMRARRTWRRFGTRALTLRELATLLGLTWAVQDWIDVAGWGRMALKTAPSGGARHSVEAYVLARHVRGVAPGLYHYQPAAHALHRVRAGATGADIAAWLPRQDWYGAASALVVMTAVFPRVQWRYPFARAYRTVLAEVGHHCQNFCLVATSLGLAPFCTMALADTRIERDLRIDGITESALYVAGVGPRPAGVAWAPWPETTKTPQRVRNHPERERSSRRQSRG
jgi:SagB-type dehydrogenase family enzyme